MKTKKEIEEHKNALRYKHQKIALYAAMKALLQITTETKDAIAYAKENNRTAKTAERCLELARGALAEIERSKNLCIEEMKMERPAEDLSNFMEE
jgi:hypothetical protein